jgi:peptidoglycan/xylan/chitin deacetylase (PgdA/CDA1 family)
VLDTEPRTEVVVHVTFHAVGAPGRPIDDDEDACRVDRARFESLLDVLAKRPAVRLHFDDGNASDLSVAAPALQARGLTATFFLPVGLLGKPGYLRASQVRELADAGMTVGSHGLNHRPWPTLADDDLDEEIAGAKRRLEDLVGRPVTDAACPFGAYDRRTLTALRDAGFERVFTSDRGVARPSEWIQPRNTVHRDDEPDDLRRVVEGRPGAWRELTRRARLTVKRWR